MDEIADGVGAEFISEARPWGEECDIAVPSATQNEIDEQAAQDLADGGCRILVEAANMPLTDAALAVLLEAGVTIAPGKAANAGGVAVSGFEMTQNRAGRSWSRERLDEELRELMRDIYARARDEGRVEDRVDLRRGADRAGFMRVARSLLAFGAV
jgi:glutamate dehydrogenase (NADP+)